MKRFIGIALVVSVWLTVLMTWLCPHGMHGGEAFCVIIDPIKMLLFLALFFPIILLIEILDMESSMSFWIVLLTWSALLTIAGWLLLIRRSA